MSPPWMQFNVADYLTDTGHLTTLEHGAYLLLILHYWREGELPSDEQMIRRVAKLTLEQWAESRDVLASFFKDGWRHNRIDEELTKANALIEKRRIAAEAQHAKRKSSADAQQVHGTSGDTRVPHEHKTNTSSLRSEGTPAKPDAPLTEKDKCWIDGKATLVSLGVSERQAGSMIGKWLRDTGEDFGRVLGAIQRAREHGTGEPIPFVTRILNPSKNAARNGKSTAAIAMEFAQSDDAGGFGNPERSVLVISGRRA